MAKRRRKRGAGGRFAKAGGTVTRRRRRRRSVAVRRNVPVYAANPKRRSRRRRRSVALTTVRRSRRRLRRNPPFNVRGIVGTTIDGAKNGTAVLAGQVIARKIRGATQGMLPSSVNVSSGLGQVGVTLGAAVLTSIGVGFLPGSLRRFGPFIVAGAFSEAMSSALALTPVAPYLSAFPRSRVIRVGPGAARRISGNGVNAWPGARVGAWPMPNMGLPVSVGT